MVSQVQNFPEIPIILGRYGNGMPGPAEWVGQPGHALVIFEILIIFTSFQQEKEF